jgi:WD40 repeat protein
MMTADPGDIIRTWEYHSRIPLEKINSVGLTLRRAILSPDATLVIACGNDPTIRAWERSTTKFLRNFHGHTGGVTTVRWIPRTRHLISSGLDSSLIIWNIDSGELLHRFGTATNAAEVEPKTADDLRLLDGHFTWIRDVVVLPKGDRAISAGNDSVLFVWDLETTTLTDRLVGHLAVIMALALSPDGRFVASVGNDKAVFVWQIGGAKILHRWSQPLATPPAVAFSTDGSVLAIGGDDGVIRLIDVQSGDEMNQLTTEGVAVTSLAFSAESELVAGCGDGTVRIYELSTAR